MCDVIYQLSKGLLPDPVAIVDALPGHYEGYSRADALALCKRDLSDAVNTLASVRQAAGAREASLAIIENRYHHLGSLLIQRLELTTDAADSVRLVEATQKLMTDLLKINGVSLEAPAAPQTTVNVQAVQVNQAYSDFKPQVNDDLSTIVPEEAEWKDA